MRERGEDVLGEMKRVYLSCPVIHPDFILQLQEKISESFPKFDTLGLLHVTLFHYGKPESLFDELSRTCPELTREIFMKNFSALVEHNQRQLSSEGIATAKSLDISVTTDSLDVFGDVLKPILVMRVMLPDSLQRVRDDIYARFCQFLEDCGVGDVVDFMLKSTNLQYQVDYNPHISLGLVGGFAEASEVEVAGVEIQLGPVELANYRAKP